VPHSSRLTSRFSARLSQRSTALAAAFVLLVTLAVPLGAGIAHATGPCDPGSNRIVCENSKPGTDPDVWDIERAGDKSIQGFATDISVNVGSRVDFKIDSEVLDYTVDIYRTGWYQGLGARFIDAADLLPNRPAQQDECITDAATELYDCGTWGVSASWDVPSDAVSGVYVALLTRADTGGSSHILFVVRDEASTSDVLFQTSDPTWHAYNTYGGSDFYQGADNGRAFKISYNRPFNTRADSDGRDFYFSSEYAQVRFLERNGYDVSYFSGIDTDRFGSLLTNHSVFLSVGHDEYWSGAQKANIEAARDAGVNLQFLAGNEGYWRTRYEPSADAGATPYRTLVSYKETWSHDKVDPEPQWTGTWRDPRFAAQSAGAGLPENKLIGTLYQVNYSDLAVSVSSREGKLRLWRNTSLSDLPQGATASLAPHTVGYESNEDVDNGFRPGGLIHLSTTTGDVPEYLQDYGNTVRPGTTTHHLTLYRAPSGALVFSAGSVQWAWGLDAEHDGDGAPADPRMMQAQVNLLADMGAQPGSLDAALVAATASTDTTAPTVTVESPMQGATVPNGRLVELSGTASDVGGKVAAVEVSTDGGASWHPAQGTTDWSYEYVQKGMAATSVLVRAVDDSANYPSTPTALALDVTGPYTFFGDALPSVPDGGDSSPVELGLRFTPTVNGFVSGVRFFKSSANTGTHTGSLWRDDGVRLATTTFTDETPSGWQMAAFDSAVPVTAGRTYVVSYFAPNGRYSAEANFAGYAAIDHHPLTVAGGYGSAAAGVYSTTQSYPTTSYQRGNYYVDAVFDIVDNGPLVATQRWPLAGSSSVPASTDIRAVLSKDVLSGSVDMLVRDSLGAAVSGATTYDPDTRTATFTPSEPLAGFVTYSVSLTARGAAGPEPVSDGNWSFTTVKPPAEPGVCPCSLYDDGDLPSIIEVGDPDAVTLGVRFSATANGIIRGIRFYKAAGNTGTHVGALWSASGESLATAVFSDESTSGWQTVYFPQPVSVTAGTEYVASYRTPVGHYSATPAAYVDGGFSKGPLRVAAESGVYSYPNAFPNARTSTGYSVDVVFETTPDPLTVVSTLPAAGALDVARDTGISITFSTAIADGYEMTAAVGSDEIDGSVSLSGNRKTIILTPDGGLPADALVDVTVSGIRSTGGIALANQEWSFRTADSDATSTTHTILGNEVPTVLSATDDPAPVELGMAFTASEAGSVTAIRFFKGTGNVGSHTGSLWNSAGERLATVTFTAESATGWQTAPLSAPVPLNAGEQYVVSYYAPQGHYSYTSAYFQSPRISGPLTGIVGRFLYGSGGGFPTYSWNASNYFVDLEFTTLATGPAPTPTPTPTPEPTPTPTPEPTPTPTPTPSPEPTPTPTPSPTPEPTPPPPEPSVDPLTQPGVTSLFTVDSEPQSTDWDDAGPVQVGMTFASAVDGDVLGVRFYKGSQNTGVHRGYLWSADGDLLTEATFMNESAGGWQFAVFGSPVPIVAGENYTVSYLAPNGRYALTPHGLANPLTAGPLSSLSRGGAYIYGTTAPVLTTPHNFWVDTMFRPAP
jgi:hypothetical protein